MILADIGNRHIHIFKDGEIHHLKINNAIKEYASSYILYISVNTRVKDLIASSTSWQDISSKILLKGSYEGMGVDRKALCLSRGDGLYIDAGSALTIDIVERGVYQGGMILPGLHSYKDIFTNISPALSYDISWEIPLDRAPKGTLKQLSYGIIAPIYQEILNQRKSLPLYVTGGDGKIVASWFEDAILDETLVFEGIKNALDRSIL